MSVLTQEKIKLAGFDEFDNCTFLEIENKISMHPTAILVGEISNFEKKNNLFSRIQNQKIIVKCLSSNDEYINIFCGYINEIEILKEGCKYYKVKLSLISASNKLDHKKYYRSYQDVSKTYGEIIEKVSKSIVAANIDCNLTKNSAIAMPVIQYAETNWDFIKRMASNCNASVMVDETKEKLKIIVGRGKGNSKGIIKSTKYTYGISDRYYEKKGFTNGLSKNEYEYIEIESKEVYDICDIVTFMDRNYYVCGKKGKLIEEEILYTYILGTEAFLYEKQYNNRRFAGCTILGDVASTSNETLKLDLNLEDEEDSSCKYDYKWVPESGNTMYCMPKVGTTVSLYFYNESEKSAVAVNCIRTNGGNEKVFTKEDKIFTTEHDKGFKLSKDAMHFVTEKEGEQLAWLSLIDENGTVGIAKDKIVVKAKVAIGLVGAVVELDSKGKLGICQSSNDDDFAQILIYYLFEIMCENVEVLLREFLSYKIIDDAPKEKAFEWGKWWKNLVVGLAVVAVVTAAVAITIASCGAAGPVVAGAVAGGLASGVFAVGTIQVGDIMSGQVTDTDKMALKVAEETFMGALTGALSGGAAASGKTMIESATKVGTKAALRKATAKKIGRQLLTEEFNAFSTTIISNATDNYLLEHNKNMTEKQKEDNKKGLCDGVGWNMAFAGIFTGADNIDIGKMPGIKNTKIGKKLSNLGAKGFDDIGEDMGNDIRKAIDSNPKAFSKYSKEIQEAENVIVKNAEKTMEKQSAKDGYEQAVKEAQQALKDARKAGNKYTKSQANKKIKKLQEKIKSSNDSIKRFKKIEDKLMGQMKYAKLNKYGIGTGVINTSAAFSQSHTYINSAKTAAGYEIRDELNK